MLSLKAGRPTGSADHDTKNRYQDSKKSRGDHGELHADDHRLKYAKDLGCHSRISEDGQHGRFDNFGGHGDNHEDNHFHYRELLDEGSLISTQLRKSTEEQRPSDPSERGTHTHGGDGHHGRRDELSKHAQGENRHHGRHDKGGDYQHDGDDDKSDAKWGHEPRQWSSDDDKHDKWDDKWGHKYAQGSHAHGGKDGEGDEKLAHGSSQWSNEQGKDGKWEDKWGHGFPEYEDKDGKGDEKWDHGRAQSGWKHDDESQMVHHMGRREEKDWGWGHEHSNLKKMWDSKQSDHEGKYSHHEYGDKDDQKWEDFKKAGFKKCVNCKGKKFPCWPGDCCGDICVAKGGTCCQNKKGAYFACAKGDTCCGNMCAPKGNYCCSGVKGYLYPVSKEKYCPKEKDDKKKDWGKSGDKDDQKKDWSKSTGKDDQEKYWGKSSGKDDHEKSWGKSGDKDEQEKYWSKSSGKDDQEKYWGKNGEKDKGHKDAGSRDHHNGGGNAHGSKSHALRLCKDRDGDTFPCGDDAFCCGDTCGSRGQVCCPNTAGGTFVCGEGSMCCGDTCADEHSKCCEYKGVRYTVPKFSKCLSEHEGHRERGDHVHSHREDWH